MRNDALFIIRIKSNWKWDENYRIATRYGPVRVVCFGSIEQKVDDYLATNIPEAVMSHEERAAAYRRAIEVLQSFQRFWGMGELSIHRWKGFELYPVINKKTVWKFLKTQAGSNDE